MTKNGLFRGNKAEGKAKIKKTLIFGMMIVLTLVAVLSGCSGSSSNAISVTYSNGTLDTASFNHLGTYPGMVLTDADPGTSHLSYGKAIAIQSDGKLVVAGYVRGNGGSPMVALARYNSDGTPDTGFGTSGIITTAIGNQSWATAVAIQTDGKIVVAGYSDYGSHYLFTVARYTSAGVLDSTFGGGPNGGGDTDIAGTRTTSIGSNDAEANAVVIDSTGNIVVAGWSYTPGPGHQVFTVARYTSAGTLDTAGFGTSGVFIQDFGSTAVAYAVAIQPADQKIVVAGASFSGPQAFTVIRLTAAGSSLDTTFGTSGVATAQVNYQETLPSAMALQSDGKIVVTGYTEVGGVYSFAIARFTAAGLLDTDFNPGGTPAGIQATLVGDGTAGGALAVAIQGDGKIVAAGYARVSSSIDFALVRYNTDGSPDTSFGTSGIVITPVGTGGAAWAYGVAIQSDGKIVAAGYGVDSGIQYFATVRYGN